jgi:hypothetical protein
MSKQFLNFFFKNFSRIFNACLLRLGPMLKLKPSFSKKVDSLIQLKTVNNMRDNKLIVTFIFLRSIKFQVSTNSLMMLFYYFALIFYNINETRETLILSIFSFLFFRYKAIICKFCFSSHKSLINKIKT